MNTPQVVDLNESIRQTAEMAQTQFHPNGIQLDLRLSAKSPRVLAPPDTLTQALLNLVADAIDAMSSVGTEGTIRITSAVIRNHVLVAVVDDAPMASIADHCRLSSSRNMIREIGGDVWVSRGEACGTTFIIDLPAASVN
jgi:signal transduction histidine kinase